jgi:hypothetical protein
MATDLYNAFAMVAPFYNLGLVVISLFLFWVLFRTSKERKGVFIKPWAIILIAVGFFILESALTILRNNEVITFIPKHFNGFFELAIISLFIYMLLIQKDYIKKHYGKKRKKR